MRRSSGAARAPLELSGPPTRGECISCPQPGRFTGNFPGMIPAPGIFSNPLPGRPESTLGGGGFVSRRHRREGAIARICGSRRRNARK